MKYDDASWHYGGEFPDDLPDQAGATHTGMFVSWALLSGLSAATHVNDFPEDLEMLRSRRETPGAFFWRACDGKFTDEDLSDEGNAFAADYFDLQSGQFIADYEEVLGADMPESAGGIYYVADTWDNFDLLATRLDFRLAEWRGRGA